ncbi:hypothetical protein [Streptomyces sp. NPDC005385]|uniref:hypothetical protein n=1 Tax=Streptomyces sp. NPDC005385 TaxID=3157039 RepID=UPI0033A2ABC5
MDLSWSARLGDRLIASPGQSLHEQDRERLAEPHRVVFRIIARLYSRMSEGKRGSARWRKGAWSVVICAILAGATAWLLLPGEADPHDYLREPADVVYRDGSLATVLTRYGVSVPDQAMDVRFHDDESLVGSEGTLFLHFKVSDADLTSVLQTLHAGPLTPGLPDDWDTGRTGQRFGWSFPGKSWRGAQGPAEGTVTFSFAVTQAKDGVNSVYVIAIHV